MSAGSFCRSPSAVTTKRPRAAAKPAAKAAVWPKLRVKRMTRTRGSRPWTSRRRSNVRSVLPSSTRITSYGRPRRSRTSVSSACSGATLASSSRSGMTTESSSAVTSPRLYLRPAAALHQPPADPGRHDDADERERHRPAVRAHQLEGRIAVVDRQEAERQVAGAAGNGDRRHELRRPHLGHAGGQDEQLEWRRRRQQRRDHQRQQPVALVGVDGALQVTRLHALAQERLAPACRQVVDDVAAGHRSRCRHGRVVEHPRLVLRYHQHDEQVVDLRQREEGGIEERDAEQPGTAETDRKDVKPADERPHLSTGYSEPRLVTIPPPPRLTLTAALLAGVAAWVFYFQQDLVLSHYDAKAHLVVARRVIDNMTPGWKQVGAVWLPLPHLIQLLPTQIDLLYRTGAFGSMVSIAAFATAAWAAAHLVLALTGSALGAVVAGALLLLNPNLLYLQATPMTEPLLL